MEPTPLSPDARALEEAFFAKENAQLLAKLREQSERQARRDALRAVITDGDDPLLDHLIDLGIGPETALAVMLVPLVRVAWADGAVEAREREAILKAAAARGMGPGQPAHALLSTWLAVEPGAKVVEAWRRYVNARSGALTAHQRGEIREAMIGLARGVAEAAGGFLGLGSKISAAEQKVLDEIEATLR